MAKLAKPADLLKINYKPPMTSWMDTPVDPVLLVTLASLRV